MTLIQYFQRGLSKMCRDNQRKDIDHKLALLHSQIFLSLRPAQQKRSDSDDCLHVTQDKTYYYYCDFRASRFQNHFPSLSNNESVR